MRSIVINGCIYKRHLIFDTYAASKNGYIIDINKQVKIETQYHNGYLYVNLKWGPCEKIYEIQQFVWECFNGIIPKNGVIKNITGNNKICCLYNLKLVMEFENHRFYKFHPFHDLYSTDHYGNIFDVMKRPCIQKMDDYGYYFVNLKCGPQIHKYPIHQFVWECFNGILPKNGMIEHFDGNKKNNCLHNLRLVLQNSQKQ